MANFTQDGNWRLLKWIFLVLLCILYICGFIVTESALWADSVYKSICPSVCPCVRLSVCVCVHFNGLFAPTSRSRMSNTFRDSESLGKSNRKKWSHIWTFLFENCQKSPRKKKFLFCWFAGLFQWGGYITTWGGYIEIWVGYIGMMRLYWDWFWMIFSVFQKNQVLGYSWSTLLWHRCYYPHRSRGSVSPVCGILKFL